MFLYYLKYLNKNGFYEFANFFEKKIQKNKTNDLLYIEVLIKESGYYLLIILQVPISNANFENNNFLFIFLKLSSYLLFFFIKVHL